ncbi:MAG: hypothetical protein NC489_23340 [Ruminococcus flavefaciens]|nr:hypothetical protein [Ruminococcus flavefaciens]
MDDLSLQIYDLIQSEKKSADKITRALADIGDGKMNVGIKRVADFFMKTGSVEGEKRGLVKGEIRGTLGCITTLSVLYCLISFIKKKINKKKEYEAEGKIILRALEDAPNDSDEYSIAETNEKNKVNICEQKGVFSDGII